MNEKIHNLVKDIKDLQHTSMMSYNLIRPQPAKAAFKYSYLLQVQY